MNGFWGGRYEKSSGSSIQSCFKKHEAIKKRAYETHIPEAEHSTFTPLLFFATGGMAHEATIFFKRLFSLLLNKWKELYASVLGAVYLLLFQLYNVSEGLGLLKATTSNLLL